ncbi:hypothetical protein B0H16DRAFT_371588 [Mycena metata]|uniref:Uncharacterized protein n=1 Tax=Mycena metata TaxID=1033252 RepID=A0AAD7JLT1_9AGAR|nr:hypothetical protein B0H16DRAFT_371588 [Mycena metata]
MDAGPALPLDLEREIFETTALLHISTIPALLRVSHRVFAWIEPLLYRALRIDSPTTAKAIERVMHERPPIFFSDNVRHFYFSQRCLWTCQKVSALVRLCPYLVSLFFEGTWPESALLPVLDGILHLRSWRGSLRNLFGGAAIDLSLPFFRTITHLDVTLHGISTDTVLSLHKMPALSHLCLHNTVAVDLLSGLLEQCPRLRILLILCHPAYAEFADPVNSEITDMRCVVVVRGFRIHDWHGWLAEDGHDFWAGAEAFVARKRRGEIPVSARWLEPWW